MNLSLDEKRDVLPGVSARVLARCGWLTSELLATAHSRERVREWFTARRFEQPAPNVADALSYHGDDAMLAPIVAAVQVLPPPVRDYILDTCSILGVGWSTRGWTSGTANLQRSLIIINGSSRDERAVRAILFHEAAHRVLLADASVCPPAAGLAALTAAAKAEGRLDTLRQHTTEIERQAEALAAVWLGWFPGRPLPPGGALVPAPFPGGRP